MGFGRRWTNWISMVLATSSTRILLNGQLRRRIYHARGLRQGNPLSPMLFVPIMESLNNCLSWVEQRGFLSHINGIGGYRVSLYVDDLVLFVLPQQRDLEVIRGVLSIFGLASGLFSNLDKSVTTPLNCSDTQIQLLHNILPYRVEDQPCRYLGVPLSVRRLTRSQEQPIIQSCCTHTWVEGADAKGCWTHDACKGDVVGDPSPYFKNSLPFTLGDQRHRQAMPHIYLGWHRRCGWRKV